MNTTISIMCRIARTTAQNDLYNKKKLTLSPSISTFSQATSQSITVATVSREFHSRIPTCVTFSTRGDPPTRNHSQCPCQPKRSGQSFNRCRLTSTMVKWCTGRTNRVQLASLLVLKAQITMIRPQISKIKTPPLLELRLIVRSCRMSRLAK